jgi:hypothetical protein
MKGPVRIGANRKGPAGQLPGRVAGAAWDAPARDTVPARPRTSPGAVCRTPAVRSAEAHADATQGQPTPMRLARSRPGRDRTGADVPGRGQDAAPETTLDEVLDLVLAQLPHGLVGATSAERVRAAVANVPAELVARFGLECHLRSDGGDAGVLFSADSETGGMQMLAGRHPLVSLPDTLAHAESWAPVVRFCGRREPGFLLHRATRDVWVDLARHAEPSFSFGLRGGGSPEAPGRPLEVLLRVLELGIEALRGAPLEPHALESLRALVRRLPETARVDRAGLEPGSPDGVRLWLSRLSPEEIADLVEVTRDGAEARRLRAVLDDLAATDAGGRVCARIGLGEGVAPGIGLICSAGPGGAAPQVAARRRALLDRLVASGLCTTGERDALLACHRLLRERSSERWPAHLTRLSKLFGDGTESILECRLHHVTVECDRGEPVRATANVVAAHGWSRR